MLLEHISFYRSHFTMNMCNTTAGLNESTHMVVRQTTAEVCGLMQTAWHQPAS